MNYEQSVQYIETLALRPEKRPGLERIEKFLSSYDCPQNKFASFHVGGTNGKGSTVSMLDVILRAGKIRVGKFTGPHFLRLNERFHIDGFPISDDEFAKYTELVKTKCDQFAERYPETGYLSWFEFLTAIAFFYFADHNIDIGVIEVGLGGRFDATNVLQKIITTGITNIALDHERILGNSLEAIASEKAGIIKHGVPVVTGASGPALEVIQEQAIKMLTKVTVSNNQKLPQSQTSRLIQNSLVKIKNNLSHSGTYQYDNALLALHMVSVGKLLFSSDDTSGPKISMEDAVSGLKNFHWPGRFQIIERLNLILDCAHNPSGIQSLRNSLDHLMPQQHFHFVFACYADKDGQAMLKELLRPGDGVYLTTLPEKRPLFSNASLSQFAKELDASTNIHKTVSESLAEAMSKRRPNEFVIATGSFCVIRSIMKSLGWTAVEDGLN